MLARLSAFVIWALVAATAVFWGLRLFVTAPAAPLSAVAVGDAAAVRVDLSRLLGAAPPAPVAAVAEAGSRFRLLGIVAPPAARPGALPGTVQGATQGVALIAVDGKLARAYRVGAALDGELVLQSVSLRSAAIGPARGAPTLMLEMPALPVAATGTLVTPSTQQSPQIQPLQSQGVPGLPTAGAPPQPSFGPAGVIQVPQREPGAQND